jgi:PTS system mannose-specific IIA component
MIGVVVVAHYRLGEELLQALRLIVPEARGFAAVSVDPKQSVDEMRAAISEAIDRVEQGSGVLILTDMFGGTPSNIALSFLGEKRIEIVTGVNLPMLIKLSSLREGDLLEVARVVREQGKGAIYVASEVLEKK